MTSTALGYQMMIEQHLLQSMVSSEQRNNFYIACAYAKVYAKFLNIDKETIPKMPISSNSVVTDAIEWQKYYFDILMVICEKMKLNLIEVRNKYGKGKNTPMVIEKIQ